MHLTFHGIWIYIGLLGGILGVFYHIYAVAKLIKYYFAGRRCAGIVKELEYHSDENGDKYNLKMEYYYNGDRLCGSQEDFVKMEKPFTAEAKYTSGTIFNIIVNNRRTDKYVLRHRFISSVWASVVGIIGYAVLAVIMAKLCIFGFNI